MRPRSSTVGGKPTPSSRIDDRLAHDVPQNPRENRRLEGLAAFIDTLGRRPRPGWDADAWDHPAVKFQRHLATLEIDESLGQWPGWLERSAYAAGYDVIDVVIEALRPAPGIEGEVPEFDIGLCCDVRRGLPGS